MVLQLCAPPPQSLPCCFCNQISLVNCSHMQIQKNHAQAITAFITEDLAAPPPSAPGARPDTAATAGTAAPGGRPGSAPLGGLGPSSLLKMLRPAPAPRPLFLAAPGVANAQSAYCECSGGLCALIGWPWLVEPVI